MWNNQTKSKLGLLFVLFVLSSIFLSCRLYKGMPDRSTMFEGTAMSDAATSFKKKLGGSFKALSVQINHDSVTLRARTQSSLRMSMNTDIRLFCDRFLDLVRWS